MRTVVTLFIAVFLLLAQSALAELLPPHLPTPALGVLVILHVGLSPRWTLVGQVLMGFATGYLLDVVSGAPRGTHALVYTLLVLLIGRLAPRVSVRGILVRAAVCFGTALLAALAVLTTRALVSQFGGFAGLRFVPVEAAFTAILGPAVLGLLDRLDGREEGHRGRGLHRGGLPL